MAVEDVVTDLPSLSTPAMHPGPEPGAKVPISAPPTPADDSEFDGRSLEGIYVLDRPRKSLSSTPIKVRIDQLPRRVPRVDIDQPRTLTDDE
jgi:hypothetical protein